LLVLNASDVSALFGMEEAFAAVTTAAIAHVEGTTSVPPRAALSLTRPETELLVMPGIVEGRSFGLKTWYAMDADVGGLPRSSAVMLLLIPGAGLEAVLDAGVITDLRTGAMTGVAARHLARPGAETAAIVGAGIQARTQAVALVHACPSLREIRVSSRNAERRAVFTRGLQDELAVLYPARTIEVVPTDSAEAACRGADVLVAATTSSRPVIDDAWVGDEALVCGIGSHTPEAAELDPATVSRAAVVVVDTHAGGIDGAGDISGPIGSGGVRREDVLELGTLLQEGPPPGLGGVRVFKSVGFAAADVVAAEMVARAAILHDRGVHFAIHL